MTDLVVSAYQNLVQLLPFNYLFIILWLMLQLTRYP